MPAFIPTKVSHTNGNFKGIFRFVEKEGKKVVIIISTTGKMKLVYLFFTTIFYTTSIFFHFEINESPHLMKFFEKKIIQSFGLNVHLRPEICHVS